MHSVEEGPNDGHSDPWFRRDRLGDRRYIPQIVHLIKEHWTAGISISAFSLWCTASLLFLIHAAMIGDAVFVGAQTVNLVAGGLIVGFCKRYEGEMCPFHRDAYH